MGNKRPEPERAIRLHVDLRVRGDFDCPDCAPHRHAIPLDVATETIVADTVADTIADTVADTIADTLTDTLTGTLADTVADTITDTVADTLTDTITDTVADTVADTRPHGISHAAPDGIPNVCSGVQWDVCAHTVANSCADAASEEPLRARAPSRFAGPNNEG